MTQDEFNQAETGRRWFRNLIIVLLIADVATTVRSAQKHGTAR